MKTFKGSFVLFIAGLFAFSLISCEKDKKSEGTDSYLQVTGANYIDKSMPSASGNGPQINDILGNSSVIEGGSNPITIYSDDVVKKILVGVKGKNGYYEYAVTNKSSASYYMISVVLSTEIPNGEFTIILAVIDNDGLVSDIFDLPVEVVEVGTGKLQVSLSWDQLNDVDLHLYEPGGEEIYFVNDSSENGGVLDLDSNPICFLDAVNNENITYSENATLVAGEYIVTVDLYSNCSITEKTNYIVTARLNGNIITGTGIKNPYNGYFDPAITYLDEVEAIRFTLTSNQIKSTATTKMRTIRFPNARRQASSIEKINMSK